MTVQTGAVRSERIVVLAPFARDAAVLDRVLREWSFDVASCALLDEALRGENGLQVGAFLLTAEAMKPATLDALTDLLGREPLWSTPPVILLGESEERAVTWGRQLVAARDGLPVTVLIRPSSPIEIASAVQSALLARRRQYDLAELIERHRQAEKRAEFLFEELSHRLKNVFSMVSAIGVMTEAATDGSKAFREAFRARMQALTRAYDTLREDNWQAAPLHRVVSETVGGLLMPNEQAALSVEGPEVRLVSRQVSGLGLVLHELASNARKYGALSDPDGRVSVTWSQDADGLVRLLWAESGGPPVVAPDHEGFGTTVIRSSLPDADVDLAYDPHGFRCHLTFTPTG